MLPQVFPCPQIQFFEVATHFEDLSIDAFIPAMQDDTVLMGELAYNYLALEASATYGQYFHDWNDYSPQPDYIYNSIDHLPPASPAVSVPSPSATDVPFLFPPPPSPSFSQASSSSSQGDHQVSPKLSPTPEPSCRKAIPMFNHIRGKWCCSVCNKAFRGKWECRRHIGITGKRAMCLACGGKLTGREDSMKRHFTKYCKGDIINLRFEDAFTEV